MNEYLNGLIDQGDQGVQTDPAVEMEQKTQLEDAINEKNQVEAQEQSETQESEEQKSSEDAKFASKFAALSRKEKDVRQREMELEQRAAELNRRLEEMEAKLSPKEEVKEPEIPLDLRLRKDPIKTLEELGLSYERLTDIVLNEGKVPNDLKMDVMRREMEDKYQKQLEDLRNEYLSDKQKAEEEKYQQVIQNYMGQIADFVNTNQEQYELIKANDSVDLVYNVIEEHYNETGRILDTKEAADHVEKYLEEEARKIMKLKKFQTTSESQEPVKEKSQSPTLSNTMSSQVSTNKEKFLSDEESKAAVAALLRWND